MKSENHQQLGTCIKLVWDVWFKWMQIDDITFYNIKIHKAKKKTVDHSWTTKVLYTDVVTKVKTLYPGMN